MQEDDSTRLLPYILKGTASVRQVPKAHIVTDAVPPFYLFSLTSPFLLCLSIHFLTLQEFRAWDTKLPQNI